MAGQYGVKETCEAIDFGMALAGSAVASLSDDGKVTMGDLVKFAGVVPTVLPAVEGAGSIPKELGELDAEDLVAVKNHVLAKMPSVGDKWLVVAQESINIAVSAYRIINAFR